jgi:hypothetical protein
MQADSRQFLAGCPEAAPRPGRPPHLRRRDSSDVLLRQGSENRCLACIVQPQNQDAGLQQGTQRPATVGGILCVPSRFTRGQKHTHKAPTSPSFFFKPRISDRRPCTVHQAPNGQLACRRQEYLRAGGSQQKLVPSTPCSPFCSCCGLVQVQAGTLYSSCVSLTTWYLSKAAGHQ